MDFKKKHLHPPRLIQKTPGGLGLDVCDYGSKRNYVNDSI